MTQNLLSQIKNEPDWLKLNKKQQDFCSIVLNGSNCFLSGAAGTGKSFVLKFLFDFLERNHFSFGKTSTTGISAFNIGGSTIHSWAGVGLADTGFKDIIKNVLRNKKATDRIRWAKLLFIDEISMCSAELLDILDKVFQNVRFNKSPFGGIQIVFSGDAMQLPPIIKNDELNDKHFFFESDAWNKLDHETVVLNKLIRQDETSKFAKLLNELRIGNVSNIHLLEERVGVKFPYEKGGVRPAKLFGFNKTVENYNNKVLESLPGKAETFWAVDFGEKHHIDSFNKNCPAAQKLELKVNAQVMLLRNLSQEEGLVNGVIGIVRGFQNKLPVVEFNNGVKAIIDSEKWEIKEQYVAGTEIKYRVVASRSQIPLKLAWSYSIHKSQGLTLEAASIDLNQAFESGMFYVALSRVKNLESLYLEPFDPSKVRINPKCLEFYKNLPKTYTINKKSDKKPIAKSKVHVNDESEVVDENDLF